MKYLWLILPVFLFGCEMEEEEEPKTEAEEIHILPSGTVPSYEELKSISVDGCVLRVSLDENDNVAIDGHPSTLDSIKFYVKEVFRLPAKGRPNDCRELKLSNEDSVYNLKRGVYVELSSSPKTTYGKYIEAQDEIAIGVQSLREDYAKSKYNAEFKKLKEPLQREIKELFPLRIYEKASR